MGNKYSITTRYPIGIQVWYHPGNNFLDGQLNGSKILAVVIGIFAQWEEGESEPFIQYKIKLLTDGPRRMAMEGELESL